jgi:hypothetical protein
MCVVSEGTIRKKCSAEGALAMFIVKQLKEYTMKLCDFRD